MENVKWNTKSGMSDRPNPSRQTKPMIHQGTIQHGESFYMGYRQYIPIYTIHTTRSIHGIHEMVPVPHMHLNVELT